MNRTIYIWVLRAISLGFVVLGLWTFLSPSILGVERAARIYNLAFVQAALIPLWPHPAVHVAITLAFILLAMMVGVLGLFRIKVGWWGIVILCSFYATLFSAAFLKSYILDGILRYGSLFAISTIEINFLIRVLIYSAIFVFMFRDNTLNLFGIAGMKKLSVASGVLAINLILALMLYDFVR